jgi:hypothetical protein
LDALVVAGGPPRGEEVAGPVSNALALLAGVVERAPPPALQALLDAVGSGQPLRFSLYV